MAKIMMEEYEELPILPKETLILVKVDDIEVREIATRTGNTFQKLNFKFKVMDVVTPGDGSPRAMYDPLIGSFIYGSTSMRLLDTAENKLKQWVEALLGMELSAGFELDTDYLIGRTAKAITGQYEKKMLNPRTNMPYMGQQVDWLLPMETSTTVQTAQTGQQAQQPQAIPAEMPF